MSDNFNDSTVEFKNYSPEYVEIRLNQCRDVIEKCVCYKQRHNQTLDCMFILAKKQVKKIGIVTMLRLNLIVK